MRPWSPVRHLRIETTSTFPHKRGDGVVHDAGGQSSVVGHRVLLHYIKGGVIDDFIQNFLCYIFLQELQYLLNFPLWVLCAESHMKMSLHHPLARIFYLYSV